MVTISRRTMGEGGSRVIAGRFSPFHHVGVRHCRHTFDSRRNGSVVLPGERVTQRARLCFAPCCVSVCVSHSLTYMHSLFLPPLTTHPNGINILQSSCVILAVVGALFFPTILTTYTFTLAATCLRQLPPSHRSFV